MKKAITTDQTAENVAAVIEVLTESPVRLEALGKSAADELRQPLGKDARTPTEVRAREAEGEERERLWQAFARVNSDYEQYRKWTSRHIPVVVFERVIA